ncbi:MAG: hypothetical protein VYA69_00080 [Gemmatimonadota bacterium]|nr:hypothetical protein [Gemmatimonadota bacterium]
MRYLILVTVFLFLALQSMDRKETRMGITPDVVEITETAKYFDTSGTDFKAGSRTGTHGPVCLTVVPRLNGEMTINLSTPLPISLTEMASVARYVGMLKFGRESGAEITPERARIESIDRYNGLGLRWHVGDDRFFYCIPIREKNNTTFKSALLWLG